MVALFLQRGPRYKNLVIPKNQLAETTADGPELLTTAASFDASVTYFLGVNSL
jgi:hypothetical protein